MYWFRYCLAFIFWAIVRIFPVLVTIGLTYLAFRWLVNWLSKHFSD